jgi:bifunctional UDP-N-acetylglucosamine pyrophosphorylase/glucosamine-1-phosphate N-acetyltransferase
MKNPFSVAILAAGLGTRFKSRKAKVLHSTGGRTMIEHVVEAAVALKPAAIHPIVGHQAEDVISLLNEAGYGDLRFIRQKEQRGTGHALLAGRKQLESSASTLLVLSGDIPLLRSATLKALLARHRRSRATATVLTAEVSDPSGYGRVLRDGAGALSAIIEQKLATPEQLTIREINTGIYCFQTSELFSALRRLRSDPLTAEYYLTDVISLLVRRRSKVIALACPDATEVIGVNHRVELARVDGLLRHRRAEQFMLSGVTILNPETVSIGPDVFIGPDTVIEAGVHLNGKTKIGRDCRIGSFSVISDSTLASSVSVLPSSIITESRIASGARIGPFSHIRPECEIGSGAQIGAFVEVKKSRIGRNVRSHHLSYLGDAVIGSNTNIGAGTITCNYDGVAKHQTIVEDNVFIGSGSELVAPVRVGKNAYVAAGSTITAEVAPESLAIARARQSNRENWVKRRRKKTANKK